MKIKKKPRQLNLSEIWKLYNLLKPAIDGRDTEELVIDEIFTIVEKASPQSLLECMYILYDNKVDFSSPHEFVDLFVLGLHENDFISFCSVIKGITNDSSKR